MLKMRDVEDVGCWGCDMLGMWEAWDMECLGCGMFAMWDVRDLGCSGSGMFGIWDVGDVGSLGCGMFGMWDVCNVGCSGCGIWDVRCLPGCGMLIYKIPLQYCEHFFSEIISNNLIEVGLGLENKIIQINLCQKKCFDKKSK